MTSGTWCRLANTCPSKRVFFFLDKLVTGIGDFGRGRIATVFQGDGYRFSA